MALGFISSCRASPLAMTQAWQSADAPGPPYKATARHHDSGRTFVFRQSANFGPNSVPLAQVSVLKRQLGQGWRRSYASAGFDPDTLSTRRILEGKDGAGEQ